MESCSYGDWVFWRKVPAATGGGSQAEKGLHLGHIVSASAFTFSAAYRESSKYARGLQGLADAIGKHLPTFTLRLYCDASVEPASLRRAGDHEQAIAWEETLSYVEAQPHVNLVWFSHARFLASDGDGHVDLFGTFARFIPLFAGTALPAWAGSPPTGVCVASSDVDYGDYATEHAMLHALQWLAWGLERAMRDGAPIGSGGDELPSYFGLAAAGSAAARHSPACGLPPTYSGLLATKDRWPIVWLDDFLRDASEYRATGSSRLLSRFLSAVHDPSRWSPTYAKRRLSEQRLMPFGVDEFFLTNVVKPMCIAASGRCTWLFLIIPAVDAECSTLLRLVEGSIKERPSIVSHAAIQGVLDGVAQAAGQADVLAQARTQWDEAAGRVGPSTVAADDECLATIVTWRNTWPSAAASRVSLWSRFGDQFDVLDPKLAHPVAAGLRTAMLHAVQGMASGALSHSDEALEQALQNAAFFSTEAPALSCPLAFSVGAGAVVPLAHSHPLCASLMSFLHAAHKCGVPRPDVRAVHAAVAAVRASATGGYTSAIMAPTRRPSSVKQGLDGGGAGAVPDINRAQGEIEF